MSQIRITSLALGLLLSLSALSGCGDRNSQATFDPATFKHVDPVTWKLSTHKTEALAHIENCTECHGSDFTGGISKVDCTSQCHLGGADSAHPLSWGKNTAGDTSSIIIGHKNSVNPASCTTAACHAAGGAAQQKLCTSCHVNPTSKHPEDFTLATSGFTSHANYVNANTNATCAVASCHGTDLLANSGAFGPSCHACHPGHF
ncbi:MAG: hypothetical protein A2X83_05180 [Desulfuromonadales bacterium GWD2_54_10]|nr:MAG: hypothetical protein A2X83_05180 [Desulfuromonadales bacterium GWD2_54_10]